MTSSGDQIPLRLHRTCIAQYLRKIAFPTRSVAARIIEERLPVAVLSEPVRPALVLWACAANGGELADAVPVAAAFDLFDRFLVLHDELTDPSSPTVAKWGLGQSLNAGDALYALAFRTLASDVIDPARRVETARIAGEAVLEAIDGARAALTRAALQAGAVLAGSAAAVVDSFGQAGVLLAGRPQAALAALRECTPLSDLAAFEEVARYVARRAA